MNFSSSLPSIYANDASQAQRRLDILVLIPCLIALVAILFLIVISKKTANSNKPILWRLVKVGIWLIIIISAAYAIGIIFLVGQI